MTPVPGFRAMTGQELRSLIGREFGYQALPRRGKGDHEILVAPDRPQLIWGFGKRDLSPIEVRRVLVKAIGLTIEEAKEVMRRG